MPTYGPMVSERCVAGALCSGWRLSWIKAAVAVGLAAVAAIVLETGRPGRCGNRDERSARSGARSGTGLDVHCLGTSPGPGCGPGCQCRSDRDRHVRGGGGEPACGPDRFR